MRFRKFIFLFSILLLLLFNFGFAKAAVNNTDTDNPLTFQARVGYQRAIEEVYWRHRIWPKENPGPKPPLGKNLPDPAIISKVEDYLRKSNALELYWQRPITAQQLQAEMDRMVKNTKQPQLLKEIFATLNNDPHVIAECLARPAIVDRLIHNWYANDYRFHGELRQRVQNELSSIASQNMRVLSGKYSEVERINESASKLITGPAQIPMTADKWKEWKRNLESIFGKQLQTEKLSPIQEDSDRIYTMTVLQKENDRIKIAMVEWLKTPFESWWTDEKKRIPIEINEELFAYRVTPILLSAECINDTWTRPNGLNAEGRLRHVAVWTGTEMIIWGGSDSSSDYLASGRRYDPSTDTWAPTSMTNVPEPRSAFSVVWTGTEMIVWGGANYTQYFFTGGKYDPMTDTWTGTTTIGAPEARYYHTAVWTGTEMIIWGGLTISQGRVSTGARYDPSTDIWTNTSMENVPEARSEHTAIWTGNEMIVWGGIAGTSLAQAGGRYDPSTNKWTAMSIVDVPAARYDHTAVWSGIEMIIWGGSVSGGARYNPSTDTWIATNNVNAPEWRGDHTAIWTGNKMIIWGGWGNGIPLSTGASYDPLTDTWAATTNDNVPTSRFWHTAVWTGTEMIVWGGADESGILAVGGRYNPVSDSWVRTGDYTIPSGSELHSAVWTGTEMIIWNGRGAGARYDPATDNWTVTSSINVPVGRGYHTTVWTGNEMIIWGGLGENGVLSNGAHYNPFNDIWTAISSVNAPEKRFKHTAVWTGTEMIVWGGASDFWAAWGLSTGARYNPSTDSWNATSIMDAPEGRFDHTAIWSGTEMIVWGGISYGLLLNSGGRYNPSTDSWLPTSYSNVPDARSGHSVVWTGTEMIIWGGLYYYYDEWGGYEEEVFSSGSRYHPLNDTWIGTSSSNAPTARFSHTAVWTGSEMIIWGGTGPEGDAYYFTGARYDPITDSWIVTNNVNSPQSRHNHTAIWTGSEMIVWGGYGDGSFPFQNGGLYCAIAQAGGVTLSISDASIEEGKKGGKTLKFVVTLSNPVDFAVKVDYATADGTATEGGKDYLAKSGTKRIRRGATSTTIKIKVRGDKIAEGDETFTVNLTNAVGVGIADPQGVGTIMNDD